MDARHASRSTSRGFSLIELTTVVFIIAIVVALTLPALRGTRDAARGVATTGLIEQVNAAVARFQRDNAGRAPGRFSPFQMGRDENGGAPGSSDTDLGAGLTAMENMLLDLSGSGAVFSEDEFDDLGLSGDEANAFVRVYPGDPGSPLDNEAIAIVNPALLGGGGGGDAPDDYFSPPSESFITQATDGADSVQSTDAPSEGQTEGMGAAGAQDQPQLPDLVDAWGSPLLAWVADTDSVLRVRDETQFARASSTDGRALFYWNSNAGFLRSQAYGEDAVDMTAAYDLGNSRRPTSLIGSGVFQEVAPADQPLYLAAFLGSPDHPVETEANLSDTGSTGYNVLYPLRGRGNVIIQSAGLDGVPFSVRDPALRRFGGAALDDTPPDLRYGINFFTPADSRRLEDGRPAQIDFADAFDDIISGSN